MHFIQILHNLQYFHSSKCFLFPFPQVNFFDDHTKLILSSVKGDYMVTYIDPERVARTYGMAHILKEGCTSDIGERMTFARSMLKNLVDIEGADI